MSAGERPSRPSIFREKALEYHRRTLQEEGDVLHLAPQWTGWAYRLLVGLMGVGLFYCLVGTVHEYASGPAVVRVQGRTDLTVAEGGVVATVEAQPGQQVEAGQTLVTFLATEEQHALDRIRREMELQLVRFMRDPADQAARQSLTALNAQLEQARSRLEARTLKAPFAGVLGDVRIQPGQFLAPGTHVLSLQRSDTLPFLLAFLPGHYRPMLQPGMPLRVELQGFRFEYQDLIIESVGSQIIGPNELERYLGPDLAGAVRVAGPIVVVRASIPARTFTSEGKEFNYFDGMPALVETPVRAEPIWTLLVPGWRGLFSNGW